MGDVPLAAPGSAVMVEGGETGERPGLSTLHGTEFWQRGEQHPGGARAYALHGAQTGDLMVES